MKKILLDKAIKNNFKDLKVYSNVGTMEQIVSMQEVLNVFETLEDSLKIDFKAIFIDDVVLDMLSDLAFIKLYSNLEFEGNYFEIYDIVKAERVKEEIVKRLKNKGVKEFFPIRKQILKRRKEMDLDIAHKISGFIDSAKDKIGTLSENKELFNELKNMVENFDPKDADLIRQVLENSK